jgi:type 1 glutamine amidotransferase
MPEGFEALGGENLRDLLAFVCAGENRFRFIDLNPVYTADSRRGIYVSQEGSNDTLKFKKFGVAMVAGVPFNIVDPAKNMAGRNLLVLKGGGSGAYSKTFPQRVEAKVGFALGKLHFLGGVAGWGYPFGGDDTPVMKLTVHYADGQKEEMVMKNGHEFADYIRVVDVPGSTLAEGVVTANQVRTFSKPVSRQAVVEKLVLESFDNGVAPTTVAITAELPGAPGAPAPQKNPASVDASRPFDWDEGTRVLLVGGGSSHNFDRFFNIADSATLKDPGHVAVHYTEDPAVTARELPRVDVAVLSVNKEGFPTEALRQALLGFVEGGKGLVLLHPGVWYNWREWPEYNRDLAGGGSRGHDAVNEFEVKVTGAAHPLTKDLPATFKITDELYWFQPDAKGTPIQILASTHSPSKKSEFPMIWVVKHPKARIAGIALGHDARAHDLPEYKQLLKNAVNWAARQDK